MHSSSRGGARVIWLAVHTTEGIMRATTLRDWTSWAGSSHAASDETGALLTPADGFVPYDLASWTLRNGNAISENIEQCGWARWTRDEWLSRPLLLDATARWLGARAKARGIPLVKLSPAEVRARKPGVLGHGDYSTGTGDGTHWDPGPAYPWDYVLAKAVAYRDGTTTQEDDLDATQAAQLADVAQKVGYLAGQLAGQDRPAAQGGGWKVADDSYRTLVDLARGSYEFSQATQKQVAGLQAAVTSLSKTVAALAAGDDVDVDALAARLGEAVRDAIATSTVSVDVNVAGKVA